MLQSIVSGSTAAAAYAGPGDIVGSATGWWGLRGYTAAVAATGTQKSVTIRRASDDATADIVILTTGYLDVATATTHCAATTCFVTKFWDQSGNSRDISQATGANQAQIFLSSGPSAGYPYVAFTAGTNSYAGAANFTPTTGVESFSTVANRSTGTGLVKMVRGGGGNEFDGKSASANNWILTGNASSITAAANDAAWHAGSALLNGASSAVNIDNSETTGTVTGFTGAAAYGMVGANSTTMKIVESGFWYNITFTSQNRTDLSAQQHSAWGF
jgi:hypothetical protein